MSRSPRSTVTRIKPIGVMISSRNTASFPVGARTTLTDARRRIKVELEAVELLGHRLFDVWINEDGVAGPLDSWAECMKRVDRNDILLVLFDGSAGWTETGGDTGICHGEFQRAYSGTPGKVIVVQAGSSSDVGAYTAPADQRFQTAIRQANRFRGQGTTPDDLVKAATEAVVHGVRDMVELGAADTRRGQYYLGEALAWSKMDYGTRADTIRAVLQGALDDRGGTVIRDRLVSLKIAGKPILFALHAVPGAMTVSAARESLGRPFLKDHEEVDALKSAAGPVHLIGCNRGVTETQATNLLGFPDAIVVAAPFGIYVADPVQRIQFVLLANCRDETMTRTALQTFLRWLTESGEGGLLVERAAARALIVKVIADA